MSGFDPGKPEVVEYRTRLENIFKKYAKDKLENVPVLLEKNQADLHSLYIKVCSKYRQIPKRKWTVGQAKTMAAGSAPDIADRQMSFHKDDSSIPGKVNATPRKRGRRTQSMVFSSKTKKPLEIAGWKVCKHTDGRFYYHDKKAKKTTWKCPPMIAKFSFDALRTTGWAVIKHKDGRLYFYHKANKKTQWKCPPLILKNPSKDAGTARTQSRSPSPAKKASSKKRKRTAQAFEWKICTNNAGRMYFYSNVTKKTQWKIPPDLTPYNLHNIIQSDWRIVKNAKDNRTYYFNKSTFKTQWKCPKDIAATGKSNKTPAAASAKKEPKKSDWQERKTAQGRVFYFNPKTRMTQWKKPPELGGPQPKKKGHSRSMSVNYGSRIRGRIKRTASKIDVATVEAVTSEITEKEKIRENAVVEVLPEYSFVTVSKGEYNGLRRHLGIVQKLFAHPKYKEPWATVLFKENKETVEVDVPLESIRVPETGRAVQKDELETSSEVEFISATTPKDYPWMCPGIRGKVLRINPKFVPPIKIKWDNRMSSWADYSDLRYTRRTAWTTNSKLEVFSQGNMKWCEGVVKAVQLEDDILVVQYVVSKSGGSNRKKAHFNEKELARDAIELRVWRSRRLLKLVSEAIGTPTTKKRLGGSRINTNRNDDPDEKIDFGKFKFNDVSGKTSEIHMTARSEWHKGSKVQVLAGPAGDAKWRDGVVQSIQQTGFGEITLVHYSSGNASRDPTEFKCDRMNKDQIRPTPEKMSNQEKKYYAKKEGGGKRSRIHKGSLKIRKGLKGSDNESARTGRRTSALF